MKPEKAKVIEPNIEALCDNLKCRNNPYVNMRESKGTRITIMENESASGKTA